MANLTKTNVIRVFEEQRKFFQDGVDIFTTNGWYEHIMKHPQAQENLEQLIEVIETFRAHINEIIGMPS